jgi:hypothetical protein
MHITRMKILALILFGILLTSAVAVALYEQTVHNVGNFATSGFPLITQNNMLYQNGVVTITYSVTFVSGLVGWQIDVYSPDNPTFINMSIPDNTNIFKGHQSLQFSSVHNSTDIYLVGALLGNTSGVLDTGVNGSGILTVVNFNTTQGYSKPTFLIRKAGTQMTGPGLNPPSFIDFQTLPNQTYP